LPVLEMVHTHDPVDEIVEKIGDLSDFIVPFNKILVGIYMRPEKTKSGLILTDQYREEDRFQGKAGLILKRGPMAFIDDDRVKFNGLDPQVGEWVVFRPSDGMKLNIRHKEGYCILLTDTQVQLVIPTPDLVF
jgi:co-chaperonin GroES (HSP10)